MFFYKYEQIFTIYFIFHRDNFHPCLASRQHHRLLGTALAFCLSWVGLEKFDFSKKSEFFRTLLLSFPKTEKKWPLEKQSADLSYADIFLEALGSYGDDFRIGEEKIKTLARSPLWNAKTRGTVHHYFQFFKGDKTLAYWSKIMSDEDYNLKSLH